jgi:hypothetical protein
MIYTSGQRAMAPSSKALIFPHWKPFFHEIGSLKRKGHEYRSHKALTARGRVSFAASSVHLHAITSPVNTDWDRYAITFKKLF